MRLGIFWNRKEKLRCKREGTARAMQIHQAGTTGRIRVLGAIHGD